MQIKEKVLKSNPGTIQTYPQPTFKVTNSDKSVVGYYIYFGSNITIDPVVKGSFVKQLEYTPKGLKNAGTYYFIIRAKNKNGSISDKVITEYRYKNSMGILLGPFDPIKLVLNVINSLMSKGLLSVQDARMILRESLDPNMPDSEKDKFVDSLFIKDR